MQNMQAVRRRCGKGMFKKFKTLTGQNRFSKRNQDFDFTEEAGYKPSGEHADNNIDIPEHKQLFVHFSAVFKSFGKSDNERVSFDDDMCNSMGDEDSQYKAVADKKAYKTIAVCIVLSIAFFFLVSSGINKTDRIVSELKRGSSKRQIKLEAEFEYEHEHLIINPTIQILAPGESSDIKQNKEILQENWLQKFAERVVKDLNKNSEGESLVLPEEKDGVKIKWVLQKEDMPYWIFAFCVFICLLIYFSRYDSIKKKHEAENESFESEIPKMIFSFILLLNAGLVTENAFSELLRQNENNDNPLYRLMNKLKLQSESENVSFVNLLYSYAINNPNRDFLRFAGIIYENSGRGSELAQKLEAESEMSYNQRLLMAKAKVSKADTKLCFPLVLLLLSLVIICIAPAMISM